MSIFKVRSKLNNRKGFTTAELLTVVAIMSILSAIAVGWIFHYAHELKLMEMDNDAQEIYIAAQNHLTQAKTDGLLSDDSTADDFFGKKMKVKPDDWPEDQKGLARFGSWKDIDDDMYYVVYDPSSSKNDLESDKSILSLMLPYGSVENTIRTSGKYVIEYNRASCKIYGVFYSDRGTLTGKDEITEGRYFNEAGLRDEKDKDQRIGYVAGSGEKAILGYYGGPSVSLGISKEKPLEVSVDNGEKLEILVKDPNYNNHNPEENYIYLKVKGITSGNEKNIKINPGDLEKDGKSRVLTTNVNTYQTGVLKNVKIGSVTSDGNYRISLDDVTTRGGHFAELCPNLIPGEDINVTVYGTSSRKLSKVVHNTVTTNSLFEKTDITDSKGGRITVTASISKIRHIENLDEAVGSLLVEGPNNTFRQNVSLVREDKDKSGSGTEKSKYIVADKAVQTRDINYSQKETGFSAKASKDSSGNFKVYQGGINKSYQSDGDKGLSENSFFGIFNNTLKEYDGGNHEISNVDIHNYNRVTDGDPDTGANTSSNAAMFRIIDSSMKIHNLELKNFDVSSVLNNQRVSGSLTASALAGTVSGGNLSLSDVYVTSDRNKSKIIKADGSGNSCTVRAGGIVANAESGTALSIENCGVDGQNLMVSALGSDGAAGGVLGYSEYGTVIRAADSRSDAFVEASSSNSNGRSENAYAGGFAGFMDEPGRNSEIINCYSGGRTVNGEYGTSLSELSTSLTTEQLAEHFNVMAEGYGSAYAGGFAGVIYNGRGMNVSNCYSTSSASATARTWQAVSGGFVGSASGTGTRIDNSYATGLLNSRGNRWAKGAFAGYLYYGIKGSGNEALRGINKNTGAIDWDGTYGGFNASMKTDSEMEASGDGAAAHPFDSILPGEYSFRSVAEKAHYGDWPIHGSVNKSDRAMVENGNKLMVHIALASSEGDYSDDPVYIFLRVKGLTSGNTAYLMANWNEGGNASEYWLIRETGSKSNKQYIDKYSTNLIYKDLNRSNLSGFNNLRAGADHVYSIVLDDPSSPEGSFSNILGNSKLGDKALIPGENVQIDYGVAYKSNASPDKINWKKITNVNGGSSAYTNSIFGSGTTFSSDMTGSNAVIHNFRNLMNLDSGISGCSKSSGFSAASQDADLSWNEYINDIKSMDGSRSVKIYNADSGKVLSENSNFPGISIDNRNPVSSYEGGGHTISSVTSQGRISGTSASSGLFSVVDMSDWDHGFTVSDLTLSNSKFEDQGQSGKAEADTGALFGTVTGGGQPLSVSNITLKGNTLESDGDADRSAGFLAGSAEGLSSLKIKDVTVSGGKINLEKASYFGGLAGSVKRGNSGKTALDVSGIKIDARGTGTSSLSLKMKNEKSPWGAGGLFGCLSGTGEGSGITNSELSISMTAEKDGDNYGSLGGVSGIIDGSDLKVSGVTVSQSGSNGIILDNKSGDDNSYSESAGTGGIAGIVSDSVLNIQDSAVQSGDELAQIHGPCNTGGLVGYSDNKSSLNMKNCHVSGKNFLTESESKCTGGIAGRISGEASIAGTYASSYVCGDESAGGFAGLLDGNRKQSIMDSYASGHTYRGGYYGSDILKNDNRWDSGKQYVNVQFAESGQKIGGFAGSIENTETVIRHCYSTCSVTGSDYVGGFAGYAESLAGVDYCYSDGPVIVRNSTFSDPHAGDFAGFSKDTMDITRASAKSNYFITNSNPDDSYAIEAGIYNSPVSGTGRPAIPYDRYLGSTYPLKTVLELAQSDGDYLSSLSEDDKGKIPAAHYGDWSR